MKRLHLLGWLLGGALFSSTAYADITSVLDTTVLTVTAGDSITLLWTVEDIGGPTIDLTAYGVTWGFVSGDSNDSFSTVSGDGTDISCSGGAFSAGDTCQFKWVFNTTADAGATSSTTGVWEVAGGLVGSGTTYYFGPYSDVTVEANVPEPNSVILLLTVIAVVGLIAGRKRLRRFHSLA